MPRGYEYTVDSINLTHPMNVLDSTAEDVDAPWVGTMAGGYAGDVQHYWINSQES